MSTSRTRWLNRLLLPALWILLFATGGIVMAQVTPIPGGGSGGGGGDGAIQDGSAPGIEATVYDYTNSNPLATIIVDTSGNPASIGGGTQYAVDTALGATPTGTLALAIRDDALSALTPVEGDAIGLRVDANGGLWVTPSGTVQVQSNSLNLATTVTVGGAVPSTATYVGFSTDAGNVGAPVVLLTGADNITNAADALQVAGFTYVHDGTTWDRWNGSINVTQLGSAAIPMITTQASNQSLSTDALAVAAFMYCYDGTTDFDLCPQSTAGSGVIDANTSRITVATDDDVSDAATLFEANLVAHDAADAGSPLKIGFKATTSISGLTEVANNDRTDAFAGIDGVLITRPHSNLEDRVSAVVGVTDGSSTSLVASQGAGLRFCATTLVVSNSSATNVTVDIRDGTAGSVIMTIPAAANMGGAVVPLQTPLCTSDATAMALDPSAAATTVTVTAIGFKTDL